MNADIMKYIGGAFFLIFVYLVVKNGSQSTSIIQALSKANSNTILALQGNNPTL